MNNSKKNINVNESHSYETPSIVVVVLGTEDVITGSNDGEWDDE